MQKSIKDWEKIKIGYLKFKSAIFFEKRSALNKKNRELSIDIQFVKLYN